uniref:Methyltransf_25 domain-containing protein n=2 Tax=Caenorhabditis japonica TaxID=281687 RepID=A0A8R1IYW9_CAEJA
MILGHYSFDFLRWGAKSVIGVDSSEEMIRICNTKKTDDQLIKFYQADISDYSLDGEKFDVATAFFVLQFIHEKEALRKAIANISENLNSGGVLFGLIPNGVEGVDPPRYMGQKLGAQIQKEPGSGFVDGELVAINFYENGEVCGSATIALHSRNFYEKSFSDAGFVEIEWISPHFTEHARQLLGDTFCHQFLNPPCDIMFKCVKK